MAKGKTKPKHMFDGYKLRMVFNEWFLFLYMEGKPLNKQLGPFTYNEALAKAKELNLIDVERHVTGDRP